MPNKFLSAMLAKWGRGEKLTPHAVSWSIAPKINSVYRLNDATLKEQMFYAFADEADIDDTIKLLGRCHRQQSDTARQLYQDIQANLQCYHNFVIGVIPTEYKSYTGLVAGRLCGQYNKPAIVLREVNPTLWSGSFRSPVDVLTLINSSGLANARGHESAAGFMCKASNLERFFDWFDNQDLGKLLGETPVTAVLTPKQINNKLCKACEDNAELWGQGVPEPTFYINTEINETNVQVFEKRTTTVKITVNGIDFLLFMATPEQVDNLTQKGKKSLSLIVTLSTNEWNGVVKPQGKIKQLEVGEVEEKDESWEDDF